MQYNEALKRFRKGLKKSQAEIAKEIAIPQTQYSRYETGKNSMPVEYAIAICQAFNVSADYLLGLSDIDKKYSNDEQENSSDI